MKTAKTLMVCSALAASAGVASVAQAEFSANAAATSNYIWRGVTQTDDQAAIQGGIDYSHDSGFYAGTWLSNLAGSQYEQDWYLGYGFEAAGFGFDVGYILYEYPIGDNVELDFSEVYVSASYEAFTLGAAQTVDKEDSTAGDDDLYLYASASFDITDDIGLGLTVGDYDFEDGGDYTHYQVAMSKGNFTLAFDKNDMDGAAGDRRVSVMWSKEWDL